MTGSNRSKEEYYKSRIIATIQFKSSHNFIVRGSKSDRMALEDAKTETDFCYVNDYVTGKTVKLILVNGQWERYKPSITEN